MNDEIKLNCAGEFMSACDNSDPHLLSTAVKAVAEICYHSDCDFTEAFGEALIYAVQQAKEAGGDHNSNIGDILEFCHTYLVKAYEKKVGRA
jgi:hypothetical protein